MAHSVVNFFYYFCSFDARSNTKQEFLSGRGDLTTISFIKPLYNVFCKGPRKQAFNKSLLNSWFSCDVIIFQKNKYQSL